MASGNRIIGDILVFVFLAYISLSLFNSGNKLLSLAALIFAIFWVVMRNKNG